MSCGGTISSRCCSLAAPEEFNHIGERFISVPNQVDTGSPLGRAMFTIIGAMAELETSLVSERVTAGMRAAETRGKRRDRPATPQGVINETEALAASPELCIREVRERSRRGKLWTNVLPEGDQNGILSTFPCAAAFPKLHS